MELKLEDNEANAIIDTYVSYLRSNFIVSSGKTTEWCRIALPYYGLHNDGLVVYARNFGNGIEIVDAGVSLRELRSTGVEVNTGIREQLFRRIVNKHNITVESAMLKVFSSPEDSHKALFKLILGMLEIHHLSVLNKKVVSDAFVDDVYAFLVENDISVKKHKTFPLTTGNYTFDFEVDKAGEKLLIKTYKTVVDYHYRSFSYGLQKVNEFYESRHGYTYNAISIVKNFNKITDSQFECFKQDGIKPFSWNAQESILQRIRA